MAYLETDEAIEALRNGYVFQFIKKPFDKERVRKAVEVAADHYHINVETRKLLKDTARPLSAVAKT